MIQNIAWGKKFSAEEKQAIIKISENLGIDPNWLTACMAFESGETFDPAVKNAVGSGAVGIIQFMRTTAVGLGTTVEALAKMSLLEQLVYVEKYFKPYKNKMKNLGDVYMCILWPAGCGKSDDYVLFNKNDPKYPKRYIQNKGLDFNKDGLITRKECCAKIYDKLTKGMTQYFG